GWSKTRSRSHTSNPSRSGSWTSSRTRSGLSSRTERSASTAFSASPTTSYPSASNSGRAPARKLGWSSTIKTVMPTVSSARAICRIRLATLFSSGGPSPFPRVLPNGGLRGGRDLHEEDGAPHLVRLDPDPAVDPADELPGDVEAESRAADPADHVRVESIELLEDAVLLCGRNTEPVVGDHKADDVLEPLESHAHVAAVG